VRLNTEEEQADNQEIKTKPAAQLTKAQKKKLREKKNKYVKEIKAKIESGEEFTADQATELANKWIEIADVDGNGTIDFNEFWDLCEKLDDSLEQGSVKELFANADASGNGELAAAEFGSALYETLKIMKNE